MFIFSPDPTKLINYDSSVIIYPSQISIERGENTSLFFKYVDSGGIGVDLSEYDASLVIKRYPTSEKILFFMNQDTVLYGTTSEDFLYSPTADTIGVGGSIVNQDDEENSMTGGIVFPIYGGDTTGIPKGNHYYEVSIRSNQERKMLFEGRIYVDDPKGATVPQEIPQKNIEIVRGEDRKFFFRKVDNHGNGIDLTGTSAIFTVRRYPSADNPLLYANENTIYTETGLTGPTGVNYTIVNQDENGNELLGGVVCSIPNPISISISPGRYFYRIDLTGSNQYTNPMYEGRIDFIQGFIDLSRGLPEIDFSPTIPNDI